MVQLLTDLRKKISMKKIKFPKGFYWGSAFSSPQTEPNGIEDTDGSYSIWEYWYKEEKSKFYNNNFSLNNFKENYPSDLALASEIGMNSLRSSISWSKLFPKKGEPNLDAVKFYRKVFEEYKKNNLKIFMNLYHFDTPMWAQEIGGWTSEEVVEEYASYAKYCFEQFGDLVDYWFTFNEPIVSVECQYQQKCHYPAISDFNLAIIALWNTNLAHSYAVEEFRKLNLDSEIGIILNITPAIPRSKEEKDLIAMENAELFQWKSYLDTITKGKFPEKLIKLLQEKNVWPEEIDIESGQEVFSRNKIDLLGINYYCPLRVKSQEGHLDWTTPTIRHFFDVHIEPGVRMNEHRGWEIFPEALYMMMTTLKEEYGNIKHFISENGMGVEGEEKFLINGIIQDDYRIEFLTEHLYWINKAMEEGANCIGYHMWTFIDNWSWLNAYKNRYGFVSLDIETGKRTKKKSAEWFKELTNKNELEINF